MKRTLIGILLAVSLLFSPVAVNSEIETLSEGLIVINGAIWEGSYLEFVTATKDKSIKHWDVMIHSSGGDAFAAIGIINRIKAMKKGGVTFTTFTESKAFSASAYIFLMGDRRIVVRGASLMVHTMLQQITPGAIKIREEAYPSTTAMQVRMDIEIGERFREVTGCTELVARYWLYGEMPDGSRVAEGAQFISAETAYNMNVATEYISYE